MAAAASVFERHGIASASIEQICSAAELTRGAFYSNFEDKDQLVMAVLDDHADREIAELERLFAMAETPLDFVFLVESTERKREGPVGRDPILFMEFLLYALRNPSNRARLAEHQQRYRTVIAAFVQADCDRLGVEPPLPVDEAAAMILALDNGYLLAQLLEPSSYKPGTFTNNVAMLRSLFVACIGNRSDE
jgi:AcrR family transcriptional regulator